MIEPKKFIITLYSVLFATFSFLIRFDDLSVFYFLLCTTVRKRKFICNLTSLFRKLVRLKLLRSVQLIFKYDV